MLLAALGTIGALTPGTAGATTPPTPPPTTTSASTATSADPASTSTTVVQPVVTGPTLPRAGSAAGDLERSGADEDWDLRRLATTALLAVAALAVAGHIYGRLQSIAPTVGRTIDPKRPR